MRSRPGEPLGHSQRPASFAVRYVWVRKSGPNGIRTRATSLKGWRPRPLDDGADRGTAYTARLGFDPRLVYVDSDLIPLLLSPAGGELPAR